MEKFNVRDVNDREIYESYMGILRISPDNDVDDATRKLINVGNDEGVALSDSDGDMLAITFKSKAFLTSIHTYGENIEDRWLVNVQTNVKNTVFAVNTVNIRPTLTITTIADGLINAPILAYSSNLGKVGVVCYPFDNPYDSGYFNDPLASNIRPVSSNNAIERDTFLKEQSPDWYTTNIDPEHYVKIDNKIVYHLNTENESIPVLYTKDKVLAHGHGASYISRSGDADTYRYVYDKNLTENLKTDENAKVTHLCWTDIDKLVWDALKNVIQGDIRHLSGRYVNLGAEVNTDIRSSKLGIDKQNNDYSIAANNVMAYTLKQTAPLVGLDVPVGNIMYNAMPYNRYMFYMAKQVLANIEKDPKIASMSQMAADVEKLGHRHNRHIRPFADRDPHFAANLVKNFVLCDGKPVDISHYPALNLDNDGLDCYTGATSSGVHNALKASYATDSKICTIPLVKFNSTSGIFLRGMTWQKPGDLKVSGKEPILTAEDRFGLDDWYLSDTANYNYRISGSSDTIDKAVSSDNISIYPFAISYKRDTMHHKHKIFSSSSGLVDEGINLTTNVPAPNTRREDPNTYRTYSFGRFGTKNKYIQIGQNNKTGTKDEYLPSIEVAYSSSPKQQGAAVSGQWEMYTAMPLNYLEATAGEFKAKHPYGAVVSGYYAEDRQRFIDYSTGAHTYYWCNKPIKNRAFISLCANWDFKTGKVNYQSQYTTADLPLIGGERSIEYPAYLLLMNEAESLMPAAIHGGWPRMYYTNYWSQREGRNSSLSKHRTKCYANFVTTGGYKIGTFDITKASSKENVTPICITSLDTKSRDLIGKLKPGTDLSKENPEPITLDDLATYEQTSETSVIDGVSMDIYTSEPSPPSLSFIPLMRI